MTGKQALFNRIQKMHEDDFSRDVVIPLLQKIGYQFTDFHGGAYEQGKDIIAYKSNEFDEIEITVVQSKMLRTQRTAKSSIKFGEIAHQLRMCLSKKIPCSDGIERLPTKVLLITPFEISTRHLSDQFENIQIPGIKIFDQSRLTELLNKYWPEIFEPTQSELNKLTNIKDSELSNLELHRALHIDSKTTYTNYYSDLNFFVGETESRQVFSSKIVIHKIYENSYEEQEWTELKRADHWLNLATDHGIINGDIAAIERDYNTILVAHNNEKNQTLITEYAKLNTDIFQKQNSLTEMFKSLKSDISAAIVTAKEKFQKKPEVAKSLEVFLEQVISIGEIPKTSSEGLYQIESETKICAQSNTDKKKLSTQVSSIGELAKEIKHSINKAGLLNTKIISRPRYGATINETLSTNLLNQKIKTLSSKIKQLNNRELTNTETRKILDVTNTVLRCIDTLTTSLKCDSIQIYMEKEESFSNELDISAHTIFDSGSNIALYGEAGAGKSTTLHVYAEKIYKNKLPSEEVLFIPLNRVTSKLDKLPAEEKIKIIDKSNNFNSLINAFLLYKDIPTTLENQNLLISTLSKKAKTVVIIDALDESANNSEWIIPALSEIPKNIKNSQVIASSRNCVKFIKDIEFLGITLLPFNKQQLRRFIFGWIMNENSREELWRSIQENELFEVAKNPLLATIICTLHENGIPVPENEPDVYRRKIELLCGLYDQHKGIKRTKTEKTFLEHCCQKIAYQMHVRAQREATLTELNTYLNAALESRVKRELINNAIHDLTNTCNILIKSSENSLYSFGHLRIQEALAAEELARNRSIDILELMTRSWWSGALFLYSFKNNIQPLIDEIFEKYGNFTRHKRTLSIMINSQPKNMRPLLHSLLSRHASVDINDGYNHFGFVDADEENITPETLNDLLGN